MCALGHVFGARARNARVQGAICALEHATGRPPFIAAVQTELSGPSKRGWRPRSRRPGDHRPVYTPELTSRGAQRPHQALEARRPLHSDHGRAAQEHPPPRTDRQRPADDKRADHHGGRLHATEASPDPRGQRPCHKPGASESSILQARSSARPSRARRRSAPQPVAPRRATGSDSSTARRSIADTAPQRSGACGRQDTSAGSSLPARRSRPRCTAAMNLLKLTSSVLRISSA